MSAAGGGDREAGVEEPGADAEAVSPDGARRGVCVAQRTAGHSAAWRDRLSPPLPRLSRPAPHLELDDGLGH